MGKTLGYGEITVANMTEPFTVMLTNEAQQFATDSNRKVTSAQSYYTDIIVIRGSQERTDYTIGNITSGSGITVSKSSKRVTFSVSAGTTIGADTGVIEIPITLDGQTVKKQFSWSCGKQGPQGVKGEDGSNFAWNLLKGTGTAKEFTPKGNLTNQTKLFNKLDLSGQTLKEGDKFVISCDLEWTQFTQGTSGTFDYWFQGSVDYSWSYDNIFTQGLQKVQPTKAEILASDGKKHLSAVCTMKQSLLDKKIFEIGIRFDNTDGTGKIKISNLKIAKEDKESPWCLHPDELKGATGDKGKSVQSVIEYYLATSASTGVTTSTSGWSTDPTTQKLTAEKKYLWNCKQTVYDDGTRGSITSPVICGTYGDKGQNAKNLTITPSSQYFKSTDGGKTFAPNTITIRPTIQGEISFGKWQYSIDGGVSFADVVSGQKGLTISNNVLTVSKDSSLYSDAVTMVTFKAVASDSSFYDTCSIAKIYDVSDIGDGRNLLWNSNFAKTDEAITGTTNSWGLHTRGTNLVASIDTSTKHNGFNTLKTVSAANGNKNSSNDLEWFAWGISERTSDNLHSKNQNYTLSFYAKASVTTDFIVRWGYDAYGADTTRTLTTNWQKYEIKLHQATSAYSITIIFKLLTAGTVWFSEFKLEKGSSATGYSTAPEDLQTAILSTKSEISDVSSQVDKNKQAIEQRVEKTTYQQDLTLVKGDISKANEGLNKWRYEIYPKSLFTDKPEDQRKISLDVFARNKNIIPTQSILLDDTKLGQSNYDDNYIGYAVTFVKMSEATKLETTFVYDDAGSFYLNGKLICTNGTNNFYSSATPDTVSCTLVKGWNCLEVIINEGAGSEGFKFGTVLSQLSTCQLMNCYYAMVTGRESRITNTLVQNTIDIEGVSTKVGKVTSIIGEDGKNFTDFKNEYSDFKQTMNEFEATVGQTYVTKDDFNGLEIGGRNLLTKDDCNMSKWQNLYPAHCKVTNNDYSNHIDYVPTGGEWEIIYKKISVTKGQKYILSFDYKVNKAYNYLSGQKYGVYLSTSIPTNAAPTNIITDGQYVIENTVTSLKRGVITFTAPIDTLYIVINGGCIDDNQTGLSFEFNKWKLEKGNKITDWTPAPEDDEINGQNLVSNLPSNWEQGTVTEGSTTGTTYANTKSSSAGSVRPKELIPVSGNITISTAYSNQSKKPIRHWIAAYDVNKNYLGNNYVSNAWNSFPRTLNMKDAKYIAIMVGYTDSSAITPSDISQICLKIERGTSATPFTLAPEDVNGKIVNVETIANQTAKKFEWIVKGGDSSSNFTLTDRVADLVAEKINFKGLVKFSGLAKSTQDKINSPTSGNLITVSPTNPTSNYGNTTFSIVSDDAGGRCIQTTAQFVPFTNYASNIFKPGEQIYYNINVPNWSSTTFDANLGIWFFTAEKKCVANSCTRVTLQRTIWNRLSGYITVPTSGWSGIIYYVIGIENPNKYQLGLVSNSYIEKTTSYATTYASSAVNWVTSNGSSTTSLNSMVKKWTDGAVSDTAQINGGWIKANTITASKIAVGDFTNYADICESNTHGFTVEKTADGVWFSKDGSKLARDNYISKMYSCEPGQTFYVEYDISNTIKDSTEYKAAGIMLFGCDGTQAVKWYQRRGAVVGTAAGTVTHMSQQLTMPSGTRFFYVVLQIEGHPPFTGTLKIRNLSVRKAVTGAVIVDGSITADKIATDAIKSRNYISSGGTQGSFLNLSDGSFTSPNLSWDSNGNLIAKNANLSGEITAINGTIGKYEITDQWLTTGSGSTCTGMGGNQAFWAGGEDSNSAPFRVGYDGKLTSSNADITGTITATNGKIGRYDITSTYLMTNSGSNASGIGGNQAFWAGAEDSNSAPFRVGYDGVLWAENAAIRGSIETGNLGDEGDTVSIINGHIGIRGTSNNVEIYSTGFKFGIDGDYYLESVSEGVKCYRNLYATDFVADGWVYCSEVHSSGAVVIGADSESFYWAHGYQIGRGTSWGGVCLGDDSQQLRLYGSSIWASHSISTSDENLKENFTTLDQYEDFYMNLNPIGFNYIGDYDGKKTHFGFGAHKTEDILESEGYDADKFAVVTHRPLVQEDIEKRFGKDVEVDIETEYGVSYTEFIALNTHMIQKTRRELTKVKQEKANLEARLQVIEAKLGL